MGKTVYIDVDKSDIYDEIARTSAYMGAKSVKEKGEGAYEQVAVEETDKAMLDRFYDEAMGMLLNLLKRFDVGSETAGAVTGVHFDVPDRFDSNLETAIASEVRSFFVNHVLSKWCELTDKQSSKEYADNATAKLLEIKDNVFHKTKPTRVEI